MSQKHGEIRLTHIMTVPQLARKIHEVVTDPERMARMSARNLETAKRYHEDIRRERYIAWYRSLRERTEEWLKSAPSREQISEGQWR